MKLLFDNDGQTCNKFWSYIYPLCDSIENGTKYYVLFYDVTINNFPYLLHNKYISFPFYSNTLNSILGIDKYMKIIRRMFSNRIFNYHLLCDKFPSIFVDGWATRKEHITENLKEEIRRVFRPADSIVEAVNSFFYHARESSDIIVGVHIRRGDYNKWREGKYFYSFEQYLSLCLLLKKKFMGAKVTFFLSANEKIPESVFSIINSFSINQGGPAYDLYGLSICDYIIGPPSSFSRFAAFLGDVNISFITNFDELFFNFRKIDNYAFYQNGDQVEFDF